ncbi:MAG: hypothetical protein ACOC9W_00165 [Persicimonas sp.]
MDFFGKHQYKELLGAQDGPAVSIFVNIDRQNNKGKNNQLAFRNQVERARKMLEERYPDEEFKPVAEMMQELLDDEPFWGDQSKGVAAFFSPKMERIYRMRSEMPNEAVVAETFHTRPMLRPMLQPERYWVLVLDRQHTKLFEATEDHIGEVSMGDIPTNIDDALQLDFASQRSREREQGAANPQGAPSGISGSKPAFHSQNNERDLSPRYLKEFSRIIDKGLRQMLANTSDPVILAAPEKLQAHYRQQSKLPNLADEGLQQSLVHLKPAKIHEKTWPLAQKAVRKKLDDLLELWEKEYGFGKGETDLQQIARRTLMSQVRYLLIEEGRHIWGELDRDEGAVSVAAEGLEAPGPDKVDLLDELAEFVIENGGEAFVLPTERMPSTTGAAAILRGSGKAGGPGA